MRPGMDAHSDSQRFIARMQINVTRVKLKLLWVRLMTEIRMKPLQQKAALNWNFFFHTASERSSSPEVRSLDYN